MVEGWRAGGAAEAGLANVRAVTSDGVRAALPDGVADFILCVQIMHYHAKRKDRVAVARDLRRLLRSRRTRHHHAVGPRTRGHGDLLPRALAGIMRDAGLITEGVHAVTDELYRTLARKPPGD